ncbi:MAG: hypothetical protein DHS20C05_05830 [Hyphococcus sp.]|nr:MAG: hypothetical protein DHS20C05_05830 [Marinicaulis sp.]
MKTSLHTRIRSWVFDDALPFWAENGLDHEAGGYVEYFHSNNMQPCSDQKRVRVIGRQIYVFSHAAILGFAPGVEIARHGLQFLKEHAWMEQEKAWARFLNRDGSILDGTPDLYDQAFILFGLAWYYRASGDEEALRLIEKTLDTIEASFRAPKAGFFHQLPPDGHWQQNPHMHLLEALLALYDAKPDDRYASMALEIIELFRTKFFDPQTKTLAEFYDQNWNRATGEAGRLVEPGHHFEWAWILATAQKKLGVDVAKEARELIAFAEQFGVDQKTGVTYQQIQNDGRPIDKGSRTWPNTERLKAAVALYDLDGKDPMPVLEQTCGVLFERYLARDPRGTWNEVYDAEGHLTAETVPASTFYHILVAFTEVLRVLDELTEVSVSNIPSDR